MKLLGEGLLVTVFAMGIVFLVLIALMYIIKLQTLVLSIPYRNKKADDSSKNIPNVMESAVQPQLDESVPVKCDESGEIVAAIISAICASAGCSEESFRIKSIRRINNSCSEWRRAGIAEKN